MTETLVLGDVFRCEGGIKDKLIYMEFSSANNEISPPLNEFLRKWNSWGASLNDNKRRPWVSLSPFQFVSICLGSASAPLICIAFKIWLRMSKASFSIIIFFFILHHPLGIPFLFFILRLWRKLILLLKKALVLQIKRKYLRADRFHLRNCVPVVDGARGCGPCRVFVCLSSLCEYVYNDVH